MKRIVLLATLSCATAIAAIPPGVTVSQVPYYPDVTLYRSLSAHQAMPSFWDQFLDLFRLPE